MKKFVELNEKELMNVEGGATVKGIMNSYADCDMSETSFSFMAKGSKDAFADVVSGTVYGGGLSLAGNSAVLGATDQKRGRHCR
ncbi:MAG: bacteriocin [Clostridiales bacterium]